MKYLILAAYFAFCGFVGYYIGTEYLSVPGQETRGTIALLVAFFLMWSLGSFISKKVL